MVSWVEAVEDRVWGEQVTGRRGEISQCQPGLAGAATGSLRAQAQGLPALRVGFQDLRAPSSAPEADLCPPWL